MGISESAYNARDAALNYQYSSFGVSGLGLKRGLSQNLVIAPYASALAAMIDPTRAAENLARLAAMKAEGEYGFYEAVDYTRSRLEEGQSFALVRAYFAHHQGMTLVALANVLHNGALRARFHSDVKVRATELLLHERTPRSVAVARPRADEVATDLSTRDLVPQALRTFTSPHHSNPRVHFLSNGNYTVLLTSAGAGYSRFGSRAVTRWRDDPSRPYGVFVYLRDVESRRYWSAGYQPCLIEPDSYEVVCSEDRVAMHRRDRSIETTTEVVVSTEDDAEVRQVSIRNVGARDREIELTSYVELALAGQADDEAHPAFSNLFVETEFVPGVDALVARRRPRAPHEPEVWAAHVAEVHGDQPTGGVQYETNRLKFIGRGGTLAEPRCVAAGEPLSGETGSVLNPIFALRYRLKIAAGEVARVTLTMLIADSREKALQAAQRYNVASAFERTATLAFTHAHVKLRHLGIEAEEAHVYQRLAGYLVYRSAGAITSYVEDEPVQGRTVLWQYGISGDLPIVVVRIDDTHDLEVVRQLLRAHEYWRGKAFAVDLVILNERLASYEQGLEQALSTLVRTRAGAADGDKAHGGVFLLRSDLVNARDRRSLFAAARIVWSAHEGALADQVVRRMRADPEPQVPVRGPPAPPPRKQRHSRARNWSSTMGWAGSPRGERIRDHPGPGVVTPAPWINVIANERFGFQVSESGAGYTWSENSRENQLTAWSNDPVVDPPSEVLYIRDDETGEIWSPTPSPARERSTYVVRHGFGYTSFEHESHGIALELVHVRSTRRPGQDLAAHDSQSIREETHLSIISYVEWALGNSRSKSAPSSLPTSTRLGRSSPKTKASQNSATVPPLPTSVEGSRRGLATGANSWEPILIWRARPGFHSTLR